VLAMVALDMCPGFKTTLILVKDGTVELLELVLLVDNEESDVEIGCRTALVQ